MTDDTTIREALRTVDRPFRLQRSGSACKLASDVAADSPTVYVPPCLPEDLGDPTFRTDHRLRYAYVAGSMANGIASVGLVEALARAGLLGFFGAAGLPVGRVEAAIDQLTASVGHLPFGFNLIHSPTAPDLEAAIAELYCRRGIRLVEASAYLDVTLPLVRYRLHGIHCGPDGRVITPNHVIAKVSRVEVASKCFAPPPERLVAELVRHGNLTEDQGRLAARVPLAADLTAEADSAGHTDNRPALTLLPTLLALRDRFQRQYDYACPLRVGAAGGIATPAAVAAAFAMGAAYVVTGSINQACVESGSSDVVRALLAQTEQADVTMAPAGDMFEMGVKVQVLKRGTFFPMRAARLYELYRTHDGLDALPAAERAALEKNVFRAPLEEIWAQTRTFFAKRDPDQIQRAEREPKHKMALVFRWYLGQSSRWANAGEPTRKLDYQVWCGPAMGAFNEWVKASPLEAPENRRVVPVALNLLYGAAVLLRAQMLRCQGIPIAVDSPPLDPVALEQRLSRRPEI